MSLLLLTALALTLPAADPCTRPLLAAEPKDGDDLARILREQFIKYEYRIPMRDGARLYTVAYVPRDRGQTYPILLMRTPYSVSYGIDNYPDTKTPRAIGRFTPSLLAVKDGFIFVHQDVRGRMMSEGEFVDVRPRAATSGVRDARKTDEATDAWDTIDFLVKNVPNNSGKVGVWGISYPGFYAAQSAIDAHPALKAVSPQAPVTEWFLGDDFHHNGALFLEDSFLFFANFGRARPKPIRKASWEFDMESGDSYDFFLAMGPLANANSPRYLDGKIAMWNDMIAHPNRDDFWKARDPRPHYRAAKPAILTVGGLFDAENLWGALATYRAFESQSPGADVRLVLGPWRHGGWIRTDGDKLGHVSFAWKTSRFYQEQIELPFLRKYLKGCAEPQPTEAWVFESGTNTFERHATWPPKDAKPTPLYFAPGGALSASAPRTGSSDAWPSDPKKPVPYRSVPIHHNDGEFMVDDQRFAARRPDVVVYRTAALEQDLTVTGPVEVTLDVSTTGTDADFVVKLVDVYPYDRPDPDPNPTGVRMGGFQQLVRAEVFRGRFRSSFERPEAFVPGQPTLVKFSLPDVSHTFRPGHALMVQVQSSWFPMVDMNPQTFVDIGKATAADYKAATHTLHHGRSVIVLPVRRGGL